MKRTSGPQFYPWPAAEHALVVKKLLANQSGRSLRVSIPEQCRPVRVLIKPILAFVNVSMRNVLPVQYGLARPCCVFFNTETDTGT